ncbi:hypothetical protein U1Q18_052700 [Sarracenia purpurea var. burkii]
MQAVVRDHLVAQRLSATRGIVLHLKHHSEDYLVEIDRLREGLEEELNALLDRAQVLGAQVEADVNAEVERRRDVAWQAGFETARRHLQA